MKHVYLDFEFTESNERHPRVYCCSLQEDAKPMESYWILNNHTALISRLQQLKGATIIGYAIVAEIRCFLALGLQPEAYNWIDLHCEFRQLVNGCDRWAYGWQWTHQRKTKTWIKRFCYPSMPKETITTWDDDEFDLDHSLPQCNLINAKLKFLEIDSDPRKKDTIRDLILENRKSYTEEEQLAILKYCESDVKYLPLLDETMTEELEDMLDRDVRESQLYRGKWCIATARTESEGIPLDSQALQNLSNNYESAINQVRDECNKVHPFFTKKKTVYVETRDVFKQFIESKKLWFWPKTDKGFPSKKDEVLKEYQDQYPELKALRHAKHLMKHLKWYRPEAKKDFDSRVGSDGRLRCYFNPYGTATSRNSPPSTFFIPAQSKWLRALIRPPKGYTIVSADYKSQEFFITGAVSDDENMLNTYHTGDVYKDFALQLGMVDNEEEYVDQVKKLCKAVILGIGFGMGPHLASSKLNLSLREANNIIMRHKRKYKDYWKFRDKLNNHRNKGRPLALSSGWALFSDAKYTTALNFPIQGTAQDILRQAVSLLYEQDARIIFCLHDAIYLLCEESKLEETKNMLVACMLRASKDILDLEGMQVEVSSHTSEEVWQEEGYETYRKFLEKVL